MPSNEALSLAGVKRKKGASIRSLKSPAIIRFVTGWHKCVTGNRSNKCYRMYTDIGAKRQMLNQRYLQIYLAKLPAIILRP